jgi:cysteinyl-tRNA synthetase
MRETEKGQTGYKSSPLDFALWKASKPGEPAWESPWGPGRPGWHIECSAMVEKHLPGGADIHGGGTDLLFPHHENELAQSAGAHPERTFVKVWAHHGMVNFIGDKMSKSVGNILDAKEAVELHGRNAVRMWFLQSHYSQPIDYSGEILEEKRRSFEHLMRLYRQLANSKSASKFSDRLTTELREKFNEAMRDDFDTQEAIAAIFDVAGKAGHEISTQPSMAEEFSSLEKALEEVLGVLGFDIEVEHEIDRDGVRIRHPANVEPEEESLNDLVQRYVAREKRDWKKADPLREEIRARGWEIEDNPGYTRIFPASSSPTDSD